jgi:hypothetical protein
MLPLLAKICTGLHERIFFFSKTLKMYINPNPTDPELPDDVKMKLLISQMQILEKSLRDTSHLFHPEIYDALVANLAHIYQEINNANSSGHMVMSILSKPIFFKKNGKYFKF